MTPKIKYKRKTTRIDLTRYQIKFFYKFIALNKSFTCDDIFDGKLLNLSEGGAEVCGSLPSLRLLKLLGDEKLYIGCNIPIPDSSGEGWIKVLARIRWAQSEPHGGFNCHRMGLEFTKISDPDKCSLKNYLIRQQIRTAKINRTLELLNLNN